MLASRLQGICTNQKVKIRMCKTQMNLPILKKGKPPKIYWESGRLSINLKPSEEKGLKKMKKILKGSEPKWNSCSQQIRVESGFKLISPIVHSRLSLSQILFRVNTSMTIGLRLKNKWRYTTKKLKNSTANGWSKKLY